MKYTILLFASLFTFNVFGQDCDKILEHIKDYYAFSSNESFYEAADFQLQGNSNSSVYDRYGRRNSAGFGMGIDGLEAEFTSKNKSESEYYDEMHKFFANKGSSVVSHDSKDWYVHSLNNPDIIRAWNNCIKLQSRFGDDVRCQMKRIDSTKVIFTITNNSHRSPLVIDQFSIEGLQKNNNPVLIDGMTIPTGGAKYEIFKISDVKNVSNIFVTFSGIPQVLDYSISPFTKPNKIELSPIIGDWLLVDCDNTIEPDAKITSKSTDDYYSVTITTPEYDPDTMPTILPFGFCYWFPYQNDPIFALLDVGYMLHISQNKIYGELLLSEEAKLMVNQMTVMNKKEHLDRIKGLNEEYKSQAKSYTFEIMEEEDEGILVRIRFDGQRKYYELEYYTQDDEIDIEFKDTWITFEKW